jgi:hypothetical protein
MTARKLLAAVVALAAIGCGGGGDGADSPAGETAGTTAPAKNGRIITVSEDGRMASVNPDGTDRRDIDGPPVEWQGGLRLQAPGIAFFQSTGDPPQLVLVEGRSGKATALGRIEAHYLGPSLGLALDAGGGRRFAVFPSGSGEGAAVFVDIEKRKAMPLVDDRDRESPLFNFRFSPDETHLIAVGRDDTLLFPTEDPDKVRHLPQELFGATFAADGQTLLALRRRGGETAVVRVPVDDGDEQVLAEGEELGFLGTVGNAAVVQEGTEVFLTEKPGDRRRIRSDVSDDEDLIVLNPTGQDRAVLEVRTEDDEGNQSSVWGLIDGTEGSLAAHPELNGFHFLSSHGASVVLSNVEFSDGDEPASGPATLAVINLSTGLVTMATTTNQGAPEVRQSPDGKMTAVTLTGPDPQSAVTMILGGGTEVEAAGQLAGWAPDSSALLVVSLVDGQPHAIVVSLDGTTKADLGPAFNAVWVPE